VREIIGGRGCWSIDARVATSGPTERGKPAPALVRDTRPLCSHFVRDLGVLTLPAAIHKTTGASAAALGLTDRGVLREGSWADVVVFDRGDHDLATYDDPHRLFGRSLHRGRQR